MGNKFEIPIDIANVRVESVEINQQGAFVITVTTTEQGTDCHSCGRKLTKSCGHGRAVILRHLPILGRKTSLRIFPVRYECPHCKGKKGKPVTSTLSAYHGMSRAPARPRPMKSMSCER